MRLQASDAAYTGAIDASVLFKEQARAAGIDIDVVREPADGFFSNVWMKQPFTTSFWYSSLTADRMFSIGYAKGAAWNETHWDNPRFNQLLNAARGEMNEPLRRGDVQRNAGAVPGRRRGDRAAVRQLRGGAFQHAWPTVGRPRHTESSTACA